MILFIKYTNVIWIIWTLLYDFKLILIIYSKLQNCSIQPIDWTQTDTTFMGQSWHWIYGKVLHIPKTTVPCPSLVTCPLDGGLTVVQRCFRRILQPHKTVFLIWMKVIVKFLIDISCIGVTITFWTPRFIRNHWEKLYKLRGKIFLLFCQMPDM